MRDINKEIAEIRNKAKQFLPPDTPHIGNRISVFKASAMMFVEAIREVTEDTVLGVSKNRANLAFDLISQATRTVLAYKNDGNRRKLTTDQQRLVLQMAEDVLNGKTEAVQFQLARDGDGIREVFSGIVLRQEHDTILPIEYYKKEKK